MKRLGTRLFNGLLSVVMIITSLPAFGDARTNPVIMHPLQVLAAERSMGTRDWTLKTYGNSEKVKAKAAEMSVTAGKAIGGTIFNDIIQSFIIMGAAAVAQLVKQRLEKKHMMADYKPEYKEVREEAMKAAEELLCAANPETPNVFSEVLCSGEFWTGIGGGVVTRFAVHVTIIQLLKLLLKSNPTRAAVISTVGIFATSFLMTSGFVASSYLWTQSVHLIDNPKKEEIAHNLFGRSLEHYVSGNWSKYVQTEEGQIAQQVWNNMLNLLKIDSEIRSGWFYNAWRFGMCRGELIINTTIFMSAMAAGSSLGVQAAIILGINPETWTATIITALVATLVGIGVAVAMVFVPLEDIGKYVTKKLQNARSGWDLTLHYLRRGFSDYYADIYRVDRTYKPESSYEIFDRLLKDIENYRMSYANVNVEKYFELGQAIEEAQQDLDMAQEVIKNSELRKLITIRVEGNYLNYEQAKKRFCKKILVNNQQAVTLAPMPSFEIEECGDMPLGYQLQKISEARKVIKQARQVLPELAQNIISIYDRDIEYYQALLNRPNVIFPVEVADYIHRQEDTVYKIRDAFIWNFGAVHQQIRDEWSLDYVLESIRQSHEYELKERLPKIYVNGVEESKFFDAAKVAEEQEKPKYHGRRR